MTKKKLSPFKGPTSLDDKITFGKYEGATFQQILDHDHSYIDWLIRQAIFEDEFLDILQEALLEAENDVENLLSEDQNWSLDD